MQVKQGKDPFNFIRKKNARGSIGTISFVHSTFPRELRQSIVPKGILILAITVSDCWQNE